MAAKIKIALTIHGGTAVAETLGKTRPVASAAREAVQWLVNLFTGILAGIYRSRMRMSIDKSTGIAATLTLTAVDYDEGTIGDRIGIQIPGQPIVYLTAVTGTPVLAGNTYSIDTSDNACAASIAAAINASPQCRGLLTAVASSATVVLTAFVPGTIGNGIVISKYVTNAAFIASTGPLTGGVDPGALPAPVTFTISNAVTLNDTLTLGTITLTAKASAANENQFVGAVSQDADGAAIAAAINAHSMLKGIYSASYGASSSGIVTILSKLEGRILTQLVLAKSCSVGTLSATTFAVPTTDVWIADQVDYGLGAQ